MSYSITSSGTYYLGVSSVDNEYYDADYAGYGDDGSTTGAYDLDLLISQDGSQTNTTFSDFGDDISYASSVSLVSDVVSTIQGYVGDGDYYDKDVDLFELSLDAGDEFTADINSCLLYTSPSPRDATLSRMPSSA